MKINLDAAGDRYMFATTINLVADLDAHQSTFDFIRWSWGVQGVNADENVAGSDERETSIVWREACHDWAVCILDFEPCWRQT